MKEVIQKVMVYVIIVSALKGLMLNKKYEEYFKFFTGMIMILILFSPLLSFWGSSSGWEQNLKRNFLNMDIQEIQGTIKITDGSFEKYILGEYEKALQKEVALTAKEEGISLAEAKVEIKKKAEEVWIEKIYCRLKKDAGNKEEVVQTIQNISSDRREKIEKKKISSKTYFK